MSSNTINEIKNAPQTFSSWDSCMEKAYCKWPAIIGIIIAVLVVVSIIWCCVRCCCCGLSCCCGCLSCFNSCCPSGRRPKRSKYVEPPTEYRSPNPYHGYVPPPYPPAYQGPNTATFDMPGNKVNGDALPAMPTWADAKVEPSNTRDDLEMGNMNQTGQATGVVPVAGGRSGKGGYRELPHDDSFEQPGSYRGAPSTHPYGSDLGAQSLMAQNTAYDPPRPQPQTDRFVAGAAAPAPYLRSSPPQPAYAAYSPNMGASGGQARPPSLLQAGKKSYREV